jgi:hypothetical protein
MFILVGVGIVIAALSRIGSAYLTQQEHRINLNLARRDRIKSNKNKDN